MKWLDDTLQIITHPMVMLIFFLVFLAVYAALKYLNINKQSLVIGAIVSDMKFCLSYLATVAITYIITSFIDYFKKGDDKK